VIVALHGFTSGPAMWGDTGWHAPTLLGHGDTVIATGNETFGGEIERLANALPSAAVHLVGYSMGARLALALALAYPSRVQRLSLIGVSPGLPDAGSRSERVRADAKWCALLRRDGIAAFVDRWQALPMWNSQESLSQAQRASLRQQRLTHEPEQLARAIEILGTGTMPTMWDLLSSDALPMPIQLIAGALDLKYIEIAQRMQRQLPHSTLHLIPNAGHNPVLEQPKVLSNVIQQDS